MGQKSVFTRQLHSNAIQHLLAFIMTKTTYFKIIACAIMNVHFTRPSHTMQTCFIVYDVEDKI
jgi:hypothetical protein